MSSPACRIKSFGWSANKAVEVKANDTEHHQSCMPGRQHVHADLRGQQLLIDRTSLLLLVAQNDSAAEEERRTPALMLACFLRICTGVRLSSLSAATAVFACPGTV